MSRPGMRFLPIKSAEQRATLMLHKTRELLVKQQTMSVNALRSHLSEFGIIIAKGIGRIDELLKLAEVTRRCQTPPRPPLRCWPLFLRVSRKRSTIWRGKSRMLMREAI
jgi:transposase